MTIPSILLAENIKRTTRDLQERDKHSVALGTQQPLQLADTKPAQTAEMYYVHKWSLLKATNRSNINTAYGLPIRMRSLRDEM